MSGLLRKSVKSLKEQCFVSREKTYKPSLALGVWVKGVPGDPKTYRFKGSAL